MEMKRRIKRYPAAHQLDEYSNENMQVRMLRLLGLFGVISFLWMVGPQVVFQDWLGIGKGHFSDNHISSDRQHAVFRRDSFQGTLRFAASTE